ncbi:MAG: PilZ domain-containing protein [Candidatus Auribacterota bacterium]|jgi:c-di-GMP-binding flagellar brake protein YcgR
MSIEDRREFFRMPVDIAVRIDNQDDDYSEPKRYYGCIRNISGGGLKFQAPAAFPSTRPLSMRFSLPLNDDHEQPERAFSLTGIVTRSEYDEIENIFTYGVKFIDIMPHIQDMIVKFLFGLQILAKKHKSRFFSEAETKV